MNKQRTRRCIQPQGATLSAESCGSFMVAPPFRRSPSLLAVDELVRSSKKVSTMTPLTNPSASAAPETGRWLLVMFIGIYMLTNFCFLLLLTKTHLVTAQIAGQNPWYWIQQDVVRSVASLVGFIAASVLPILYWNRHSLYARMALWMSLLWFGIGTLDGLRVFYHCKSVFDLSRASGPWATASDYIASKSPGLLLYSYLAFCFLLAFIFHRRPRTQAHIQKRDEQDAPSNR